MNIFYISQFFLPENIAGAFRAKETAAAWGKRGHQVTVLTGYPNYPTGKLFPGYSLSFLSEDKSFSEEGIRVLRSKLSIKDNTSFLHRVWNALSFFFYGTWNVLFRLKKRMPKPQVVVASSGPIFAGLLGWIASLRFHCPLIFEIRDITFKQLLATGKSPRSLSYKGMRFLELFLCRRAKRVVVVTHGFQTILEENGIPKGKIRVITNGVDVSVTEKKDTGEFIVSYFGTLGISQNLRQLFPYFDVISSCVPRSKLLLIGEGAEKEKLRQEIALSQRNDRELLDGVTAAELEPYYGISAMSVAVLNPSDNFRYTLPSKIFQIMGRGIPLLFVGPKGEAAEIIDGAGAGLTLTGTEEENRNKLATFFSTPHWEQDLKKMGENGAALVREQYSRKKLAEAYLEILSEIAEPFSWVADPDDRKRTDAGKSGENKAYSKRN